MSQPQRRILKARCNLSPSSTMMAAVALLAACGRGDNAADALNTEIKSSTYFVPGWVPAQKVEGLRLSGHDNLEYRFKQCTETIAPAECDRIHKWRDVKQTLILTRMKPGSVKVLEVAGAPKRAGADDTGHAIIYRCLEKVSCTIGDLGPFVTPVIPCRDRDSCERVSAELEKLIALAQQGPSK